MYRIIFLVLVSGWLAASCVSAKKYETLENRYRSTDRRLAEMQKTNEFNEATILDLRQRVQILEDLRTELAVTKEKFAALQGSHEQLKSSYDNALVEKDKLITTYSEDMAAFSRELAAKEKDLDQQRSQLDSMARDIERREEKLIELKAESEKQQTLMNNLRGNISQALNNFSG